MSNNALRVETQTPTIATTVSFQLEPTATACERTDRAWMEMYISIQRI
jgi:hypothetical protein